MKAKHWGRAGLVRRAFLFGCAAALGAILLSAGGRSPSYAQDLQPFRIGIGGLIVNALPLWVAEEAGLYEKYGLAAELIDIEGGSRSLQVLLAGGIDVADAGLSSVAQADREGADLRLISSTANTMPRILMARPEIRTAEDLKGKTIVISTYGSESDTAVSLSLAELGLTRDDVTVLQLGGTSQRLAALPSGSADASPLTEPMASKARAQGINVLVDLSAANVPWVFDAVAVTSGSLRDNRPALKNFLRAYIEAAHVALADPERAKATITRIFKTDKPKDAAISYDIFKRLMPLFAEPTREATENVLSKLPALGVEVGSTRFEDYVDTSLLEELKAEGFFEEMSSKYKVP